MPVAQKKSNAKPTKVDIEGFLQGVAQRNPSEPEFIQAVHEVAQDVLPFIADKPQYRGLKIFERMTEPD